MAVQARNFQPVKIPLHRHSIGGTLAVAAVMGMVLSRKADAEDTFELATGKAGYFLRRDVKSLADIKTQLEGDMVHPDKAGFETPYKIGGSVQVEDFEEVWVEGPALLDDSMDETVTAGTPVTTAAGKIAVLEDSEAQETLGKVVTVVPAVNHPGPAKRFLIQIARSVVNIPAA